MRVSRRRYAVVGLLLSSVASLFAQVPNGGFETWANGSPTGWAVSNAPPVYVTVTQSSSAHSGSSAARGEVKTVLGGFTMAPFLQSGQDGDGFPYAQKPTAVTGFYQFFPATGSSDQIFVNVLMTKGGNMQTAVAAGAQAYGASSSYKQFTVPMSYTTGETPDTCYIQISIISPVTGTPTVGSSFIVDDLAFSFAPTSSVGNEVNIPGEYVLEQNYPNPFNPTTAISYHLVANGSVKLDIVNTLGQVIETLVDGTQSAGRHTVRWDASRYPSGVYFYRLNAGAFSAVRTLVLLR